MMCEEQQNDKAVSHDDGLASESSRPCLEQLAPGGIDDDRLEKLRELERKIGYTFADIRLLDLSLTHKSFLGGNGEHSECNERMEFLGDRPAARAATTNRFRPDGSRQTLGDRAFAPGCG